MDHLFPGIADESRLDGQRASLLADFRALLARLGPPARLASTAAEQTDEGFGLIIERDDQAVRLLAGTGPRSTTLAVSIQDLLIVLPNVHPDDLLGIAEGLMVGSSRLSVLFSGKSALHVNVVDHSGRILGRYGVAPRVLTALLFWKRRALFDVSFRALDEPSGLRTSSDWTMPVDS